MTTAIFPPTKPKISHYFWAITRGVVIDQVDGRTRAGRFLRNIEAELDHQLGGSPTFAQQLLIRRISRMTYRLEEFGQRLSEGRLTDYDTKVFSSLSNHIRLSFRDLGLKARPEKRETLDGYLKRARIA
jgi:hypothetical protein